MLSNAPLIPIQSNTNKMYAALQSAPIRNPAEAPLPDVVDTRRPKMTSKQIARRYLRSIKDNPSIDINKKQQNQGSTTYSETPDQRRHLRKGHNCEQGGGGGDGKRSIAEINNQLEEGVPLCATWQELHCETFGASSFGDNVLISVCRRLEYLNAELSQPLTMMITGIAIPANNPEMKICAPYGTIPVFLEADVADRALDIQTDIMGTPTGGLIQAGVTRVLAPAHYYEKLRNFNPKSFETLRGEDVLLQINEFLTKNFHSDNDPYFPKDAFDCVIFTDKTTIDLWVLHNSKNGVPCTRALAIRGRSISEKQIHPLALVSFVGAGIFALAGGLILVANRKTIANCFQQIKSAICLPKEELEEHDEHSSNDIKMQIFDVPKARQVAGEDENQTRQATGTFRLKRNSGVVNMDGRESSDRSQAAETDADYSDAEESSSIIVTVSESDSSSASEPDPGTRSREDKSIT